MSITRIILILLAITTLIGCTSRQALAQHIPPEEELATNGTAGSVIYAWDNGRSWKLMDRESKVTFLTGIEQGIMLMLQEVWDRTSSDNAKKEAVSSSESLTASGFKFPELAAQVDDFYKDRANIRIPIVDAYRYTLKKLKGATKEELDIYISKLRQKCNR